MAQRESRRSRQIMTALRGEGVFCFKVHGSAMMMTGLPDIIACVDGLFVGLETKIDTDVSVKQQYVHELIVGTKGECFVVHNKEEALACIAEVRATWRKKKLKKDRK